MRSAQNSSQDRTPRSSDYGKPLAETLPSHEIGQSSMCVQNGSALSGEALLLWDEKPSSLPASRLDLGPIALPDDRNCGTPRCGK